jgi:YVTN family beta-propeller protein
MKIYHSFIAAFFIALSACKTETTTTPNPPAQGQYSTGVLIMNEGAFGSGNGSVAWYDPTNDQVEKEVFINVNGFPTGNVLFSAFAIPAANRLYMVVNNSQKIQVAELGTMKNIGEITGLTSPRYMRQVGLEKAYVTDWGSNTVAVINLNTNTVDATIDVGNGPERMALSNTRAIVANSGGFGTDSTITVINTANDQVTRTEVVGDNPNSLVFDANGALWVLCGGIVDFSNPANNTPGRLLQIDPATFTVTRSFDFPTNTKHPTALCINNAGTLLYWLDDAYAGNVVEMNISAASLPTANKIQGSFYNLDIHPFTGEIYTTDPLDYMQDGVVYRYSPDGTLLDSLRSGLIPSNFWFN